MNIELGEAVVMDVSDDALELAAGGPPGIPSMFCTSPMAGCGGVVLPIAER